VVLIATDDFKDPRAAAIVAFSLGAASRSRSSGDFQYLRNPPAVVRALPACRFTRRSPGWGFKTRLSSTFGTPAAD
jgi:hypothetical protein